jgi:hypothetical protein
MKFSRTISRVEWLSGEKKNQRFEDHLCPRPQGASQIEDRDGLRNVGFLTAQPFDPADGLRELHYTQSPGKQLTSLPCRELNPGNPARSLVTVLIELSQPIHSSTYTLIHTNKTEEKLHSENDVNGCVHEITAVLILPHVEQHV